MSDIELRNVDSTAPLMRSLSKQEYFEGEHVGTDHGPVYVIKAGAPPNSGKPYLVTYHDLGLNFASNFQAFFNFFEMKILLRSFSVLNIHAPGQEENAAPLPEGYIYPSMDQLAEQVDAVLKFYGVVTFVGIGVSGLGSTVLLTYITTSCLNLRQWKYPNSRCSFLFLSPSPTTLGWQRRQCADAIRAKVPRDGGRALSDQPLRRPGLLDGVVLPGTKIASILLSLSNLI